MSSVLTGLKALGVARLAALAGVAAATLGLLAFAALRLSGDAPMALLYADLDLRDAAQMSDLLDKAHVPHQASADGTTLMVPRDRVAEARLDLARSGLPGGGSVGYEIFDKGDGLTASQFEQTINQTRALEGELARSIRMIRGVRAVRVHLVLARREPFAQDQQDAQASVLLTMAGAARMDREGVQAVLNLVSAAVPGLKAQNIAMIDDRGELLARAGQPADGVQQATTAEELKGATEARLAHAVEDMLARSLGEGHVRAEAAVDMDFDQTRETTEHYDPDGQVARSSQTVTDTSRSTEKDASVSVANNLPNPDAGGAGGSGSQQQRQEETTNYEIGRSTRTVMHDQPRVRRVSLAVMVDGVTAPGANGRPVWQERSPDELARIATLARSVIGFDAGRGDKVDVVSMRFTAQDAAAPAAGGLLGLGLDRGDLMHGGQMLLVAAIALVALLTVLRPAALRITAAATATAEAALLAAEGPALIAPAEPAGLLSDERGGVDAQLRASSLRRIAGLVESHPAESLAILRGWMAQEPA